MINAKKPHFLEIFLPNLSSQRLEVPSKFIKHLSRTSGSLSLTGPSGNTWHVDLTDHNGQLFFDGGWPTFVVDHSIECGDSLVFRYDGKSHFTVQIFDQSSCEKDEALNAICSQGSMNCNGKLGKKRDRGKKVSFLDEVGGKKHKGTLIPVLDVPAGCRKSDLKICTIENEDFSSTKELTASENPFIIALPCASNTAWKASIVKSHSMKTAKKKQNMPINISISNFIESRSAEYISSDSPYFVRVMNYSNIDGNGTMKVPIKFSVTHLPNYRTKVTLKNLNGDCWMVNCIATVKKSSTMHTFCGGWTTFVRANGIKIEDVCIFELVGELEMLVRILRLGVEGLENQTLNNMDVSSIEMSGWPLESFGDITQDTSVDHFLKEDSEGINDLYMYDYEDVKENPETVPAIKQEAAVCFDTCDSSPIRSAQSPLPSNCDDYIDDFLLCNAEGTILNETSRDNEDFKGRDTIENPATIEETIDLSPFPSFMKTIKKYDVSGKGTLGVPRTFSAHLPSHKTNIVLQNMHGDSWKVVSARYGHQIKFMGGWMSFARKNGVKVGDVCIFELIDDKVLRVRVFNGGHKGEED